MACVVSGNTRSWRNGGTGSNREYEELEECGMCGKREYKELEEWWHGW